MALLGHLVAADVEDDGVPVVVGVEYMGDQAGIKADPAHADFRVVAVEHADPTGRTRIPPERHRDVGGPLGFVRVAAVPVEGLGELGGRLDEDNVAGRDTEVVLPRGPLELDLTVVHQRSRGVPFAHPQERGSSLGAPFDPEEDPTTGGGIPTDVRCDGDGKAALELLRHEQA